MRSLSLTVIFSLALFGAACSSYRVDQRESSEGIPFYLSKPYLLVELAPPGAAPEMRIVYLPDYERPYLVTRKRWRVPESFQIQLGEGGQLQSLSLGGGAREASSTPVLSLHDLVPGASAGPGKAPAAPLAPGLYELVFSEEQPRQLKELRHVPFPGWAGSVAAAPVVRDVRLVTHPGSPEIPRAVVISLDGAAMSPCPPRGLSVDVLQDGGRLELCTGSDTISCDPVTQEVRCPWTGAVAQRSLVRASIGSPGGVPSSVEKHFPETADGLSAFEPQADISFGRGPDGKIRTVAITFDPRSGSCVGSPDPQERASEIDAMVHLVAEKGDLDRDDYAVDRGEEGGCLTDLVLRLHEPQPEVSVTVRPRNRSGLQGRTKFASAASPPSPPDVTPPVGGRENPLYFVQMTTSLSQTEQPGGKNGDVVITPGPPADPFAIAILHARGNLAGSSFRDLEVIFTAKPEDITRLPKVQGWMTETPPKQNSGGSGRQQAIQVGPSQKCSGGAERLPSACSKSGGWKPLESNPEISSIEEIESEKYQTEIVLRDDRDGPDAGDASAKPRILCLEVRFLGRGDERCQVLILDEFVLRRST